MSDKSPMTPDEAIEWLDDLATTPQFFPHVRANLVASAQTVRAMRDAAKEAQGVLADLTGSNPERSVLHLWARAVAAETALRSALSPKEGK